MNVLKISPCGSYEKRNRVYTDTDRVTRHDSVKIVNPMTVDRVPILGRRKRPNLALVFVGSFYVVVYFVTYASLLSSCNLFDYSAQSSALAEYWIHFTTRFGGVHAIGYNSAKSELIWMKSGAL